MHLEQGADLSSAWLAAARYLTAQPRFEGWDLAVEIADPQSEVSAVRSGLDGTLARTGKQSIETVANTIFPEELWEASKSREALYARYRKVTPKLRRFAKNRHGLYFERLTSWPPRAGQPINQVEEVIHRLGHELTLAGPKRFVYDLVVFSPVHDPLPIGFPCLAYVNVKLHGRRLDMLAHYRNHYFVERAYGNYLGLARLQRYMAESVGLQPGMLSCVSGHAVLDDHRRDVLDWLGGSHLPTDASGRQDSGAQ